MRCTVLRVVPLIVGLQHADLLAQEIQLRAGTLLDCTLQEPSFSSHSAKVGEPLNCGRFESYRDLGCFLGKGWIKLEFDRLILPNADVPISGKVVSVGGFTVDADGKILGPGHTGRDVLPKKLHEGQVGWGAFGGVAKAT